MTLQTGPVQGCAVQLGVEAGDQEEGARPPPRGPALGPIPSSRFPEHTPAPSAHQGPLPPGSGGPEGLVPLKQESCAVSQARTGTHGGWHPCSSDTAVRFPPLATLSWALGSPPSLRYLSVRASWFSAAAFRNITRSTDSSWAWGCGCVSHRMRPNHLLHLQASGAPPLRRSGRAAPRGLHVSWWLVQTVILNSVPPAPFRTDEAPITPIMGCHAPYPQVYMLKSQPRGPQNVALFGSRVTAAVIKMKSHWRKVEPNPI